MKASKLYSHLEKDFIKTGMYDDWYQYMGAVAEFISGNFRKRSMGLVCDFAQEIKKVYTAVFPSDKVLKYITGKEAKDAMLFVHHAAVWDIRKAPDVWTQMDKKLLKKFKENKISIYNLHVPLDSYGRYSTGTSFAKAANLKVEKPFAMYRNALCGVICSTREKTIKELKESLESAVNHRVRVYSYGSEAIKNKKVGIITGGGNSEEYLKELAAKDINVFITGISAKNEHSRKAHEFAETHKINIIGATHYSTEKFACIRMCSYFKKLKLASEFIEGRPVLEDM